jgi:hypothetical protein
MRNMYQHPAYAPHGIMKIIPFWEYRYPRTFIAVGMVISLAAVIGGIILVSYGQSLGTVGYAWGAAMFAAAALRGWIAYQLGRFVQS